MIEILFRGQTVDGCWVYGFYCLNQKDGKVHEILEDNTGGYVVNPDTVGQFTGLLDKNGKLIFEGDVVEYSGTHHEVVFETCSGSAFFGIAFRDRGETWLFGRQTPASHMEVFGNIHDNPELLGKEDVE